MLVLSRKIGEQLCIGDDIVVTITKTSRSRVTIGIDAPKEVPISRGELDLDREPARPTRERFSFQGSQQD